MRYKKEDGRLEVFFIKAVNGMRGRVWSRGEGDVYKEKVQNAWGSE